MPAEDYSLLLKQAQGLLSVEKDPVANAANLSSLLYFNLGQVNWVGFYFLDQNQLVLGPFHGQPACTRIDVGKGVCGTAFNNKQTMVVDDVHLFKDHIACDAQSESELVVPFNVYLNNQQIQGVLDVDSPIKSRFSDDDRPFFEEIVQIYMQSCENKVE